VNPPASNRKGDRTPDAQLRRPRGRHRRQQAGRLLLRRTPLTGPIRLMLIGTLTVRATGMTYPFLGFRLADLGYGPTESGWVLACFGAGWLIGQPAVGWTTDHYGPRRALVLAMTAGAIGIPASISAHTLPWLMAGAALAGAVYDAPRPVVSAVIAAELPGEADRVRVGGWRHGATNLGAAIVGAVGGFLAAHTGLTTLWWINGAGCAAMATMTAIWLPRPAKPTGNSTAVRQVLGDRRLWWLAAASLGALTPILGMFAVLPLLMAARGLPSTDFGIVQVANASTVLILTPVLNPWLSRTAGRRPLTRELAWSATLLGLTVGAAALARTTAGYTAAIVCSIPGEIAFFMSAGDLLNRISPPALRGAYSGMWGTTLALASCAAPLAAAGAFARGGPHLVGTVIAAAGLLGTALCLPLARSLHHPRLAPSPGL
jgi:hypothetical protein